MGLQVWNLVLAAGAGRRLAPLTGGTPKQFWRPDGRTSLLEDTLDRLSPIAPSSHTITVVDRSHRPYVEAHPRSERLGTIFYQPGDRGTATGILLGLTALASTAPDSIVVITPSDHGIGRSDVFRHGIRTAIAEVSGGAADIVLFGIAPDRAYGDYGWITPAVTPGRRMLRVSAFVEKPSPAEAARLLVNGAVWNTMVVVARTRALLDLYRRQLPHLHRCFHAFSEAALPDLHRWADMIYPKLPHHDFSNDLLTTSRNISLIVWPETMGWSDLGTPERLIAWRTSRPGQGNSHIFAA